MEALNPIVRWLLVLPLAIVSALAANILLRMILVATFSDPDQMFHFPIDGMERALLPFVAGAAFIAGGAWISPSRKITAIGLAAALAILWSVILFIP